MLGFKTKSSTYYVDGEKKEIMGDEIKQPIRFKDIITAIGCPGVIIKTDGDLFVTDKITSFI